MIVVDTNVVVYMNFKSPYSSAVEQLHVKDSEWNAPLLWRSEFLNVMALYLRRNIVEYPKAVEIVKAASQLIGLNEHKISPFLVMEFIQHSSCTAYDCEFVALASTLETKLVTYD